MKLIKVYQVEVGGLLNENDPEYDLYSNAWDHRNSYYFDYTKFSKNYDEAKKFIKNYIENGRVNTYGILSKAVLSDEPNPNSEDEFRDYDYDFSPENVIYSAYKNEKKEIIENFVDTRPINKIEKYIGDEEVL